MSQPDRARLTPYELVFTAGDFEARIFPRIRSEAEAERIDPSLRERFDFLSTAADVVREVTPEDAPPDALDQYRALLFHAFRFWESGKRLYTLDSATARYLVEAAPNLDGWKFAIPGSSVYLQLPANLFWSSISPEAPPEPVDGVFVTLSDGTDSLGGLAHLLEVLLVLGIRRSRAGFSVIPLVSETGEGISEAWDAEGRPEGDFANALPGGDMAGLYSMLTAAEVLKLIGRAFWYIETFPEGLVGTPALAERAEGEEAPTSQLSHVRVTLAVTEDGTGE
ncbi:MAG: hypothetical protein GEU90_11040 [Gemmatimonas sp.]|nr:hypothetical protein [Gemmatimonas sp.]